MTSPITQMAQGLNLNWNCCPDFCNRAASEDRDPSHVGGEWRLTTFFPLPHSKTPLAGGEWATLGSEPWAGGQGVRPSRGAVLPFAPGRVRKREGWQGRWTPQTGTGGGDQ